MLFKLLTAVLAVLLVAESLLLILMHRHPANRFKPVGGYDGFVAFDTASGQLCKTFRTRTVAEIEQSEPEEAKKPCAPLPAPSGDPVLDAIARVGISKRCGGNDEDIPQRIRDADSTLEFVAMLPACPDIR